ncbi:hypothetical protein HYPSUDRAFT_1025521 [Hypholoma sublateritium FD-334 SS-4]|uniref:C2H2-type domain-containing protein n=1 Tax=Hypholoma sublateritium (strain FD-334 SS-4) TaxID=945553 RepID=A0A0D2M298_HYPSF|nr:hypothetical protein HYPSUDRAFT_1025521 [Hypholoma sublateritium FD-334 SS-4]
MDQHSAHQATPRNRRLIPTSYMKSRWTTNSCPGLTRTVPVTTFRSRLPNQAISPTSSPLPLLWPRTHRGQRAVVSPFFLSSTGDNFTYHRATVSLSPQPNIHEYSNAFNFDFAHAVPRPQFPPSSSTWQSMNAQSSRSSASHSPTASCSSLDAIDMKMSPSREASPSHAEAVDPQAQRRRFPCVIIGCERRFTSQYTLKVHMEAHKPKPRSSFPCTLGCSERFSRQHDRLRHEVAKHGKVCEFLCDECGRFFSTKKTLGNHKCPVAQGGTRWVNS